MIYDRGHSKKEKPEGLKKFEFQLFRCPLSDD